MKNYLWNMFASIKNGQIANKKEILHTRKKVGESILKVLWSEGFISGYEICTKNQNKIKIFLKYSNGKPAINSIKVLSRPSLRIKYSIKQIWKINLNKSLIIISSDKGLKSSIDCKKLKTGGEPIIIIN